MPATPAGVELVLVVMRCLTYELSIFQPVSGKNDTPINPFAVYLPHWLECSIAEKFESCKKSCKKIESDTIKSLC